MLMMFASTLVDTVLLWSLTVFHNVSLCIMGEGVCMSGACRVVATKLDCWH